MAEHPHSININTLFEKYGEKLCLSWIGGKQGGDKIIIPEEPHSQLADNIPQQTWQQFPSALKSLVGCLNLIHPHQIQIIGAIELEYLDSLQDTRLDETLKQLFLCHPACIMLAEDQKPPAQLALKCNEIRALFFHLRNQVTGLRPCRATTWRTCWPKQPY